MTNIEGKRRSVRMRSASWLFMAQVFSLLASFPASVLLARALGASGKGTLSVVQLIATFCGVLFSFGVGQALTYYAARREASGRSAVGLAFTIGLGVSAVLGLLAVPFGADLAVALHVSQQWLVVAGLLATAPVLVGQFLNAYVIGTGAIRNASFVSVGSLVFQFVSLLSLWALGLLSTAAAVGVWIVAVSGVALVLAVLAWPGEAAEGVEAGPLALSRRIRRYSLQAWPAGILGSAAQRFDIFLLSFFKGTAQVGVYSIAVTMAELCWYIPNALGGVLIPKVAAEQEEGLAVTLRVGRVNWVITAIAGVAVVAVGGPLIPLVFGQEFRASVLPLALLVPGIVSMSAATAPASYLAGTGHPLDGTRATALNVSVNLVANVLLIPRFGAAGAALSSTISYTAGAAVILAFFVHRSRASLRDILVPRVTDFSQLYSAARRALKQAD